MSEYETLADEIVDLPGVSVLPIAITFCDAVSDDVDRYRGIYPPPTEDGRTGAVAAGCVYWAEGQKGTFATVPEDHGNCSVGCMLSRVRTGMPNQDMTCAIPGGKRFA